MDTTQTPTTTTEQDMDIIGTNSASDHIGYIWLGNGGQILIQTNTYAHDFDRPGAASQVIGDLLAGEDTAGWDGNDPDARFDVSDSAMDANGNHIIHMVKGDTLESLAKEIHATGGAAALALAAQMAPHIY